MIAARRVALFAFGSAIGVFACNGLTGIGDYSVVADSSSTDASAASDAPTLPDADAGALDAAPCTITDNPPRDPRYCDVKNGGVGADMAAYGFGFHCIDVTEVTVGQYQQFLDERGATNTCGQSADCAWNTTYTPATVEGGAPEASTPQVNVDWCDAFMYCRWAGKHLCGTIAVAGGEPAGNVRTSDTTNVERDLWYGFCTEGPNPYFYGPTSVPGTCQDAMRSKGVIAPVATASDCHGAMSPLTPPIYDMAGNAAEWEWSCEGDGPAGQCVTRGGSYQDTDPTDLACAATRSAKRSAQSPSVGFRCCVE